MVPAYAYSLTVDAPAPRVWQVLTEVEHWPELTASMTSVRGLDGPRPVLGARFEVRQPRLRRAVWTVTRLDEGTAFDWESRAPGVLSRGTHLLEPDGSATRLTLAIDQTGILAWPIALLAGTMIRRYVAMEARGIAAASTRR
ncbi:SRPBCC family protein [Streptomyces cocklensis]|uniref:Polyketide cyclase / dehydrase and lipid transport n=1 Tax=Actinacidiphila cocklensis TaxID=887465 RepID=A0A9W4GT40_9ACTN|nr:SRPBCC family protein [Actinacidiphila cocklensis]MDD1063808.1 SRPBCC family protein [Actinacidiphila cocklensis]CAG6396596.1 Polyketide cyclase / dehydrase and lipid transport [Actinacidiphila cocklensis]